MKSVSGRPRSLAAGFSAAPGRYLPNQAIGVVTIPVEGGTQDREKFTIAATVLQFHSDVGDIKMPIQVMRQSLCLQDIRSQKTGIRSCTIFYLKT